MREHRRQARIGRARPIAQLTHRAGGRRHEEIWSLRHRTAELGRRAAPRVEPRSTAPSASDWLRPSGGGEVHRPPAANGPAPSARERDTRPRRGDVGGAIAPPQSPCAATAGASMRRREPGTRGDSIPDAGVHKRCGFTRHARHHPNRAARISRSQPQTARYRATAPRRIRREAPTTTADRNGALRKSIPVNDAKRRRRAGAEPEASTHTVSPPDLGSASPSRRRGHRAVTIRRQPVTTLPRRIDARRPAPVVRSSRLRM